MVSECQPLQYDRTRLVVWPEWASSGIWHPQCEKEMPCAVSYVSHEYIGLPQELAQAFDRWIEWFDDYMPGSTGVETFDWLAFNREGSRLAAALAAFVGERFQVEYSGQSVANNKIKE